MRRSNTVMTFEKIRPLARNCGKDNVSKEQKLLTEAQTQRHVRSSADCKLNTFTFGQKMNRFSCHSPNTNRTHTHTHTHTDRE